VNRVIQENDKEETMKTQLFAIAVLGILTCAALPAQTVLQANVPFDFALGQSALPAGEYRITCSNTGLLMIREIGGKHSAMTLSTPSLTTPPSGHSTRDAGMLLFQRYGDEYFLNGVWTPSSREGLAVPVSVRQKELASRLTRPEATTIALRK
jgi:hypothetical protein